MELGVHLTSFQKRTNRFMPVIFGCDGLEALTAWKGRVIAIEDVGTEEPWDAD